MWRSGVALAVSSALAAPLGGCGGDGDARREGERTAAATPGSHTTTAATTAATTEHVETESSHERAAPSGAAVWAKAGCGDCHTLAAAGSTGTTGPNLDEHLRDDHHAHAVEDLVRRVREGGRRMPAFEGRLTPAEIRAVAVYVVESVEKPRK